MRCQIIFHLILNWNFMAQTRHRFKIKRHELENARNKTDAMSNYFPF